MNQLRSTMDHVFDDTWEGSFPETPGALTFSGAWPRANLIDAGSSLILTAEVPGVSDKDVRLSLTQDVLTLSGERKVTPPGGYSAHRQERAAVRFSRSFALPCRVNAERTTAKVKDGILTVMLEKAADAMPRQITVKSAA